MELLDVEIVKILLEYGSFSMLFGIIMIMPLELLVFGVVKAIHFFRL